MTRTCSVLILLLLLQFVPQAEQQPAFRTATLLIVQNVTVKDKKGQPVPGLTAKDFIVTEDGVKQEIAFVEYQKLDAPPLGATDVTPTVPARPTPTLAPLTAVGETLNAVPLPGDSRYRGKRLIVLYLDLQALPFFDEYRVYDGVRKYLDKDMRATDVVSVFVYQNSRVRMRQDFTDDREALRKVLDDLERESIDAEQNSGGGFIYDPGGGAFGEDAGAFNMFSMDRRLAALQTTMSNLGPLPEKKTLVYFGSGLQANTENLAQLRATVNAAVRANVTINPVDPGGLTASAPLGDATRPSPGGTAMFSGQIAMRAVRSQQAGQDIYYALAKDTGGVATFNNNDLSMGVSAAANAVTGYYMIGYYATNLAKDGKFRRVKVTLAGTQWADADVSYRPGYYGAKVWEKFNAYDKERHLEEALRLEDPITEIPIAVEVNYFQVSSAEYFVPISVRMPGSELARPRPAGDTKAVIDMLAEIKDEYGVTMRNSRDRIEFKLGSAAAIEAARRPIQYEAGFSVLPGNYVLKVLARDATTGRIGTFIHKFVVPNLDRERTRLPISTIVMSTQRVVPADTLYTVEQKISATVANPLVHDGLKLIPSVTRTFNASLPLFVFLQAYERDAEAVRPLIAFITFYKDGLKVFESEAVGIDTWDPKTRALPIRLHVAAGTLEPGSYDCQVTVLDPATTKSAFWRAGVVIVR
jgi:VWFA-related protein